MTAILNKNKAQFMRNKGRNCSAAMSYNMCGGYRQPRNIVLVPVRYHKCYLSNSEENVTIVKNHSKLENAWTHHYETVNYKPNETYTLRKNIRTLM